MRRAAILATVAALCGAPAGCGGGSDPAPRDERAARPAPRVSLSAEDRAAWAAPAPDRTGVPVLVYDGVRAEEFARQMALLDHAGFETITLDELVRFVRRRPVDLPPNPLLLTFADARLDTWAGSDAILRQLDFNAVLFVEIGPIEKRDPEVLTWEELDRLEQQRPLGRAVRVGHRRSAHPVRSRAWRRR